MSESIRKKITKESCPIDYNILTTAIGCAKFMQDNEFSVERAETVKNVIYPLLDELDAQRLENYINISKIECDGNSDVSKEIAYAATQLIKSTAMYVKHCRSEGNLWKN